MTTVEIDYAPRAYFVPYHERHQRFACIVAHRRAGKTTACIQDSQKRALLLDRPRPRFAYIAPLLKQAKAVAWDILKAAAKPLGSFASINESELRVDYSNGGQVRIFGADNPDAMRGLYLDGAVIDEPAQIDPILFPEIIRPALADRDGVATFIGTPKGRDAFYKVWRYAQEHPGEWYASKLPASRTCAPGLRNPPLKPEELAFTRGDMSPAQYAREFECSFDEPDLAQFIDSGIVDAARKRKGIGTGPVLLGVDPARFGDDRSVALIRNGDRVLSEEIEIWRGLDLMQTAGRVAEMINRYKPRLTFVDGVGVGGGVVDRLRQLGFSVVDVSSGGKPTRDDRFVNLKAEMWSRMKDWLRDNGSLPDRDDLADDLTAPLYEYDHAGRLKLERKEDLKQRGLASPDIADALALTFAQTVPAEASVPAGMIDLVWRNNHLSAPIRDPFEELR